MHRFIGLFLFFREDSSKSLPERLSGNSVATELDEADNGDANDRE